MSDRVYLKIISYNHRGVRIGNRLAVGALTTSAAISLVWLLIKSIEGKPFNEVPINNFVNWIGIIGAIIMFSGLLKSGYHRMRYKEAGQITLLIDKIYISHLGESSALSNVNYEIFFIYYDDEDCDMRGNPKPVNSPFANCPGITAINLKHIGQPYTTYEVMIDDFWHMGALNKMLKAIREAKNQS